MANIMPLNDVYCLNRDMEALMARPSLWERIISWTTAVAEAVEMDTFGYLDASSPT
jgi:hypothetical protein